MLEAQNYGILTCSVFIIKFITQVMGAFNWIIQNEVISRFYSITDDDCVLNLNKLHEALSQEEKKDTGSSIYCGYTYDDKAQPKRDKKSKW